jgi:hypothetical protein
MDELLKQAQPWQEVVAEYKAIVGDKIPRRQYLEKFIVRPEWLNGKAADYHEEVHLARVLVGVNVLFSWLDAAGLLPQDMDKQIFRDGLSAAAVNHDLELTNNREDYLLHGFRAALKLPERMTGIIEHKAIVLAQFLCEWHVPNDKDVLRGIDENYKLALWLFKDKDGDERQRFPEGNPYILDRKYLRIKQTIKLLPVTKELIMRTQSIDHSDPSLGFNQVFDQAVEMGLIRQ